MTRNWTNQQLADYEARNKNPLRSPSAPDAVDAESDLHDSIIAECRRRGWPYVHSRMDKPTGQLPGTPDFVIGMPGRTLWVECKSKTGKQEAEQIGFQMMLEKHGHKYHLVRSFREFLEIV